ncbi:MAG: response regulator [Acidobacteria bacterium]|nr:response regulator [Acidobacteriota bacterium]
MRGTTQDITERKRLEDQLLQAQKLESVGRLAGGVAHDFNNLLTVINGYSELAISRLGPAHPLRNSLEQIRAAGERAAGLTRQLLAFSRRQVLQPRVLDLNDVIVNVEKLIRRLIGEDVELRLLLGRSPGSVRADPGQVEQVIMNLAVNSRDAMPEGGTLTLETAGVRLPDESGKTPDLPPGSYVTLTVRDTGVGMDEQTRSHIFEPFFTTKEAGKGTGLGLATVYGIVRQSGGDVSVESAPGKGAAFTVYLPCTGEGAEVLRAAGTAPPQTGRETVLLVEDEPGVRELVREMLSVLGYTTLEAACGEDALRLFLERGTGIQLLLTDVIMPGMSGRELARRVCAIRPGLKVLFMSGYPDGAIVQHGAPDLGVHLIQKPISLAELGRQVRSALDADSAAGAAV